MQTPPELLYKPKRLLFKHLEHPVIFHLNVATNRPSAFSGCASSVLLGLAMLGFRVFEPESVPRSLHLQFKLLFGQKWEHAVIEYTIFYPSDF